MVLSRRTHEVYEVVTWIVFDIVSGLIHGFVAADKRLRAGKPCSSHPVP